jgi:hypothetical protein
MKMIKGDDVISTLIHAGSKVGKSTLSSTAPFPHCVFDAEGGWKFIKTKGFNSTIPLRKIQWNPLTELPPRNDGTWDVAVVTVRDWATLDQGYRLLTQAEHDFRSITLDSITEIQRRLKTNINAEGILKGYDQWGTLLVRMDGLIRGFRDLTLLPGPVQCVTFIAETRMENGKWRPYMQGQISVSLPYWVDICGYMYTSHEADAAGQLTVPVKRLLISDQDAYEAGERVQGRLGGDVRNPNIEDMMNTVFGTKTITQEATA